MTDDLHMFIILQKTFAQITEQSEFAEREICLCLNQSIPQNSKLKY